MAGAAPPAPYSCLEVGPLGPAGGAAEGPELGYGAPGATYGSKNGRPNVCAAELRRGELRPLLGQRSTPLLVRLDVLVEEIERAPMRVGVGLRHADRGGPAAGGAAENLGPGAVPKWAARLESKKDTHAQDGATT